MLPNRNMAGCPFLATSLADLKHGEVLEGDNGVSDDVKPSWYDDNKFKRGQDFFRRHVAAIGLSMHCSLVSGFSLSNLLEPLVFTHESDTPSKSYKRYLYTFYHIFTWMTTDVWDKTSKGYRSLKTVRYMHKNVAKKMEQAFHDKVYVSQYDMGLVQSGFFGAVLMYPKAFGIYCTDAELEDYVYVWRVIGHGLGIDDKYNICTGSLEQTKALVKEIEQECLIPALQHPPKDFDRIADAYIDGINQFLPFKLHTKPETLSLVWNGWGKKSPYKLSFADTLRYGFTKMMTWLMYHVPGFEKLFNMLILSDFERKMEKMKGTEQPGGAEKQPML